MMEERRKCKNCKGQGMVERGKIKSKCCYCGGKGYRTSVYGKDESNIKKMEKGIFKKRAKEFYKKGKVSEIQSYRDFLALAKKKRDEGKKVKVTIR